MYPESKTESVPTHTTQKRWVIAVAVMAILLATIGLITGQKPDLSNKQPPEPRIAHHEPPQISDLPNANIEIERLQNVEVPIIGLEEDIQQKMDAMFVKPEDALKSVEAPNPKLPPES